MLTHSRVRAALGCATLLAIVLLSSAGTLADTLFYGVDNTNLVRINASAGTAAPIGPLGVDLLADLEFDVNHNLIAVRYGQTNNFPPQPLYETWQINPTTGQGTFLHSFGYDHLFSALALRPTTGMLYTVDQLTGYLGTLDPYSGAFTPVSANPHGLGQFKVDALAFGPNGVLYGLHNETSPLFGYLYDLVTFDLVTGLGAVIGSVDGGVGDYQSLRFDPTTGTAFTINTLNGSLSTISLSTGHGTVLWGGLAPGVTGLAYIPEPACIGALAIIALLPRRRR